MAMSNLLGKFKKKFDHKVGKSTPIELIQEPLKSELKAMYEETGDYKIYPNLAACLINGLYSEGITKFLFSKREFEKLIKIDENLNRNSINGLEFRDFKAFIIKEGIINVISDSTSFEQGRKDGKAAICEIIDSTILDLLNNTSQITNEELESLGPSDEYENNLDIGEIEPNLLKEIKEKAKLRADRRAALSQSESSLKDSVFESIKNIKIEKSIYMRTVGPERYEVALENVDKFCKNLEFSNALNEIEGLVSERDEIYNNRFPRQEKLTLEEAIKKAHKKS